MVKVARNSSPPLNAPRLKVDQNWSAEFIPHETS
jgi:hypothetical protein